MLAAIRESVQGVALVAGHECGSESREDQAQPVARSPWAGDVNQARFRDEKRARGSVSEDTGYKARACDTAACERWRASEITARYE